MEYTFANRISGLRPSAIREILKFTAYPDIIPFAAGNPAPDAFPVEQIRAISDDILQNRATAALQYSITEGYGPLIDFMRVYNKTQHDIGRDFDGTIITSGAQQVMSLAAKALCNEGDTIICEAPSFIGSLNAFKSLGLRLVGVPVQSDGMDLNALETALKANKVRFIYTIPNFQNPSGVTMSADKRRALYALAQRYNTLILEDNPYGDIRFAGTHIPAIKSMDEDGRVIYAGSFSKVLAPGMRVGFAVAPAEVLSKMIVCKQVDDVHTNIWSQMIALSFISGGEYEDHLTRIRGLYRRKANLMMNLIDTQLCPFVTYDKIEGGLFIWCRLPDSIDIGDFARAALDKKVAVVPGNAFLIDETEPCNHIRLNFSTPTDQQMVDGMEVLHGVLKTFVEGK